MEPTELSAVVALATKNGKIVRTLLMRCKVSVWSALTFHLRNAQLSCHLLRFTFINQMVGLAYENVL